jgi:DNA invertase Pin-like site-specific DNA recombinase
MPAAAVPQYVFVYARASLDRKETQIAVDKQIANGHKIAGDLYRGLPVRVYKDNNRSGSNPEVVREEYDDMIAAIRRGECLALIAHEQSRLTRKGSTDWDNLVVILNRAGLKEIHTHLQGTISIELGNRLAGRLMAVIDQEEIERLKVRALAHAKHLANEGRPSGGRFYGYSRQEGEDRRSELVIIPDQAGVICRIVDELLAGHSARAVAERLNADGVPTPRGGTEWRGQSVLGIARKPHIAGLRVYHGKVMPGRAKWEPIISPERFDALQAATVTAEVKDVAGKRKRIGRARADNSRKWLLTGGIARCFRCKSPLAVVQLPRPGGYISGYGCTKRSGHKDACGGLNVTPADLVEELVVTRLKERLSSPEFAALLHHTDNSARAAAMQALAEADGRVARAAQLFGTGEIDEPTWRNMHTPATARAEVARAELAATEAPEIDLPPADLVAGRWAELPLKARQAVLRRYLKAVWVLPQEVRPADPRLRVAMRLDLDWRDSPSGKTGN